MFNAPKAFLLSLFHLFITLLVMINFLGWSGGAPSLTGYSQDFWSNSYFGFESLLIMVNDFGNTVNSFGEVGKVSYLLEAMEDVTNDILFDIPNVITAISTGTLDIIVIVKLIVTLLLQPLLLLIHILSVLMFILVYVIALVKTFFQAVGGAYNISFESSTSVWDSWSWVESQYDWDSMISTFSLVHRSLIACCGN